MKITLSLVILSLLQQAVGIITKAREEPRPGQRCRGKLLSEERLRKNCCTAAAPCEEGEGDCDTEKNDGCKAGLRCGNNNCLKFGTYYHEKDDCCEIDPQQLLEPPAGQRCAGRNFEGKRCCTPSQPCGEGEGDCDGPGDGGKHDGHAGCQGDLICGSNNCLQFGIYYHPKDDCCERNTSVKEVLRVRDDNPGLLLEKPEGQRCGGRNYEEKGSCCTVLTPCGLGEGDCEPKSDGSGNNDDSDCMPGLVCGSNNCRKFGLYYHERDDCCDYPKKTLVQQGLCALGFGCE